MSGSARGQLSTLVALRWRMVRRRRARWGFAALAATVPVLAAAAVAYGALAPFRGSFDVVLLAPSAYLSVAVLALLAPLVSGGGNELFPDDQLTAFPVSDRTRYAASLALTPLNLAWTTQLVGLLGITAFITPASNDLALTLTLCLTYVAAVTLSGHALAWLVVGLRQHQVGRTLTWTVAAVVVLAAGIVVASGNVTDVADATPTTLVVIALLNSTSPGSAWWFVTSGALVALSVTAWSLGRTCCAWALRQPGGTVQSVESRHHPRGPNPATPRSALLRTDRAGVWRSPSLRRGLLVLGLLPGLVAAAAGLDWPSLVLMPGLVAAGAGLLFGVNAFSLDGRGAPWLASQPHDPSAQFWSKTTVIAEVCAVAVGMTLIAGGVRTGRLPTPAELSALLACSAVVVARVVATCMQLSVTRPFQAELRGTRDTPAPPGVMAAYSARLALSTTLIGMLFAGLAELPVWHWSAAAATPLVLLSARRLLSAARQWRNEIRRSHVVTAVAMG